MSRSLPDVRAVIEALGGVPAVAGIFGLTDSAVFNWIMRQHFPAHTHFEIRDRLSAMQMAAHDELWKRPDKRLLKHKKLGAAQIVASKLKTAR